MLSQEKFDVIRTISLLPTFAAIRARRNATPIVANLSDFYSDLYRHSALPLSSVACGILKVIEKSAVTGSDVFIVDTPFQRRLWRNWGLDERRCVVIPHGYYPDKFSPDLSFGEFRAKYGIDEETQVLLYHGDISAQDGIDILIRSMPLLSKRGIDAKLVIVGSGTKEYMGRLLKQVKEERVQEKVIFTGWVPHAHVSSYVAMANLCVIPCKVSLTSASGFSNKLIEYLAMRKKIVMSRVRGTEEMIGDSVTYVTPQDPISLAQGICRALVQTDAPNPLMERIRGKLAWSSIIEQEEKVLDLVARGGSDFQDLDYRLTS
jgi:glycosyltransferase involved in cell wall biosynthesis